MGIEIKIPIEELRKRKLFLATPMYGGQCTGMFARSVADLSAICTHHGIRLRMYYLFNESLITRARNYCCDEFMRDDSTHLLFIDSDIGFNPNDVLAMLAMQGDDTEYDIMAAPYPKKCISWEKVLAAANKGAGDKNPNDLEKFVGDFVFNPKPGTTQIQIDQPVEVLEAGTGFMMIRRNTLQKFADSFPQFAYRPDHIRTESFDGTRKIMQYFQAEIDPKSERYLSEDYWFCQKIQELGLKTWFCPWMRTQHVGTYVFSGSLADLASVGAAATADADLVKKSSGKVGN
jgi:hypothetical protein